MAKYSDSILLSFLVRCCYHSYILTGCIIFFATPQAHCCNHTSLGNTTCVRISRYIGEQWSTCVTDLYIQQKSKGRHGCPKGQIICIYQCMLEIHGENSGKVSTPCACSTSDELKTEPSKSFKPTIVLPSWCFSPTGTDCSWFKTCIGQRYSCKGKFRGEVVEFGEELCALSLNPYSYLSKNGRIWVNGVRKCLQVNLVPLLRKWHGTREQNCKDLTKQAISSYSDCFYSPFPDTIPTICKLPLRDLWRIFWHLRGRTLAKTYRSLWTLLKLIQECGEFRKENLHQGRVRRLVFRVKIKSGRFLGKELGRKIAEVFALNKRGIVWFGYTEMNKYFSNDTKEFVFYIADKQEYTMSRKLGSRSLVNLNDTVSILVKAVRRNELCFSMNGGKDEYHIIATTVCQDIECRRNTWTVLAEESMTIASDTSHVLTSLGGLFIFVQFLSVAVSYL